MDYTVQLANGQAIELKGATIDVDSFTKSLNDPTVGFVSLGGVIVNKHIIQAIFPVETTE